MTRFESKLTLRRVFREVEKFAASFEAKIKRFLVAFIHRYRRMSAFHEQLP